jgi:S-methylmethionine-dependent homocysteine/selenocysteine methylase
MRIDAKYRQSLPHLGGGLYLTDGGIETSLIFQDGLDLPYFAAFHLLRDAPGRAALVRYYERYIEIAKSDGVGFILESPTWRASTDWGQKLGYSADDIAAVNRNSIRLMDDLRDAYETMRTPMIVSGCVGPRGDGYDPGRQRKRACPFPSRSPWKPTAGCRPARRWPRRLARSMPRHRRVPPTT